MAFSFTDYMRQAQPFDYTSPFASGGPSSGLDALAGDLTAKNPLLGQLAFSPAPLSQLLTDPQWLNAQGKAALKAASDTGQPPDLGNQNTSAASGGAGASGSYTLGTTGDPNVLRWKSQIEFASQKTGVPDYIIAAEMDFESGGNPNAVSPAGAQGLMQVMPQYHAARASKYGYSLGDPQGNILAGADYLAELHQKAISLGYSGDDAWKAAFGGYLTGDVNWQRDGNQVSDAFGSTAGSYSATVQGKIEKYRVATPAAPSSANVGGQVANSFWTIFGGTNESQDITQGYGPSSLSGEPAYNGYAHFHEGVDVGLPQGTHLYAPVNATVVVAGWSNGYGNTIVMKDARGYTIRYGHMAAPAYAAVGQSVNPGTEVGIVGSTGYSTGPHVHVEVRDPNGNPINPADYFSGL